VDYRKEYEGKTQAELKKLRTKLLIEQSEAIGIFSVGRKKELQARLEIVEELLERTEGAPDGASVKEG